MKFIFFYKYKLLFSIVILLLLTYLNLNKFYEKIFTEIKQYEIKIPYKSKNNDDNIYTEIRYLKTDHLYNLNSNKKKINIVRIDYPYIYLVNDYLKESKDFSNLIELDIKKFINENFFDKELKVISENIKKKKEDLDDVQKEIEIEEESLESSVKKELIKIRNKKKVLNLENSLNDEKKKLTNMLEMRDYINLQKLLFLNNTEKNYFFIIAFLLNQIFIFFISFVFFYSFSRQR